MYILFNITVDDVSLRKGYSRQREKQLLHCVKMEASLSPENILLLSRFDIKRKLIFLLMTMSGCKICLFIILLYCIWVLNCI